jgi:hypothetical protein
MIYIQAIVVGQRWGTTYEFPVDNSWYSQTTFIGEVIIPFLRSLFVGVNHIGQMLDSLERLKDLFRIRSIYRVNNHGFPYKHTIHEVARGKTLNSNYILNYMNQDFSTPFYFGG